MALILVLRKHDNMEEDPKRTSQKKKVIGELGRQESTVGEQLLKGLPGQLSVQINEEPEYAEGKIVQNNSKEKFFKENT